MENKSSTTSAPRAPPPSGFNFTFARSLSGLNVSAKEYLGAYSEFEGVATGALVFSRAGDDGKDRILLLQRAPHDSMPLRWEVPGGACDPEDETILHAVARELWEESGLLLRHVVRQVGGFSHFLTTRGHLICKFSVEVEVDPEVEVDAETALKVGAVRGRIGHHPLVTLDPNEHQDFVWATEDECRARQATRATPATGEEGTAMPIEFTSYDQKMVIFEGFRLRRAYA